MSTPTLYGIKNCDTMKKAFKWLEAANISYEFHDYKKQNVDKAVLQEAMKQHGWEKTLNQRGTTWRKLDKTVQENMNEQKAIAIAVENASLIKRPLMVYKGKVFLGFNTETYGDVFKD